MDNWIKCSDELPLISGYYLTFSWSGVDVTYFDGVRISDEYATHWMNLPSDPQN